MTTSAPKEFKVVAPVFMALSGNYVVNGEKASATVTVTYDGKTRTSEPVGERQLRVQHEYVDEEGVLVQEGRRWWDCTWDQHYRRAAWEVLNEMRRVEFNQAFNASTLSAEILVGRIA